MKLIWKVFLAIFVFFMASFCGMLVAERTSESVPPVESEPFNYGGSTVVLTAPVYIPEKPVYFPTTTTNTEWIGQPITSKHPNELVTGFSDFEIGLRSDGVVCWRKK